MRNRVVHIAKVTGIHGMEKHLLTLLPELNKNYNITFIVLTESKCPVNHYLDMLIQKGINVFNVIISFDIDPVCFWKIYMLLKNLRPSLVHTHLIHGDIYGICAARLAGVEHVVSTRHNDDSFRTNPVIKALNACLHKKVSRVITISQWIAHFVNKVEGVPAEKIMPIYYGLDEIKPLGPDRAIRDELGFSSREIVLGIIARLVEQKGHYYLIEAFSKAFEENPNLRLLIVGDGELKAALQNQVHKKKLDRFIRFTGYRNDVTDVLAALDIFVHPSLWEGFGLSILEAMAMGKPVIATSVSAIPELVEHGVTGILVPPKESESLAWAIARLSHDASTRKVFGQKARETWKRLFSTHSMVKKTDSLYSELLNSSLRGSGEARTYGT